jgi:hypothetical protein
MNGKHAWRSWLAHGAYVSKVEGSNPSGCIFHQMKIQCLSGIVITKYTDAIVITHTRKE